LQISCKYSVVAFKEAGCIEFFSRERTDNSTQAELSLLILTAPENPVSRELGISLHWSFERLDQADLGHFL